MKLVGHEQGVYSGLESSLHLNVLAGLELVNENHAVWLVARCGGASTMRVSGVAA